MLDVTWFNLIPKLIISTRFMKILTVRMLKIYFLWAIIWFSVRVNLQMLIGQLGSQPASLSPLYIIYYVNPALFSHFWCIKKCHFSSRLDLAQILLYKILGLVAAKDGLSTEFVKKGGSRPLYFFNCYSILRSIMSHFCLIKRFKGLYANLNYHFMVENMTDRQGSRRIYMKCCPIYWIWWVIMMVI